MESPSEYKADLYRELFGDSGSEYESSDCEACADQVPDRADPYAVLLGRLLQTSPEAVLAQSAALQQQEASQLVEEPVPGFVIHRNALDSSLCSLFFGWLNNEYFANTPVFSPDDMQDQSRGGKQQRINQGMHFGALADCKTPFGFLAGVCAAHSRLLPKDVRGRDVLFDQAIINLYDPGEGIGDHIDLLRFEDGIVGFSFGCPATMRLRPVAASSVQHASRYATEQEQDDPRQVELVVNPGDIYAMSGEARYRWTHGFPKAADAAGRRISVTLRKLTRRVH